jgi:hypothetical protein
MLFLEKHYQEIITALIVLASITYLFKKLLSSVFKKQKAGNCDRCN